MHLQNFFVRLKKKFPCYRFPLQCGHTEIRDSYTGGQWEKNRRRGGSNSRSSRGGVSGNKHFFVFYL